MEDQLILARKNNTDVNVVIDKTFFTRLKTFADYVGKEYGAGDFLIDEEWQYIKYVATECLKFQRSTMNQEDKEYFNNLGEYFL